MSKKLNVEQILEKIHILKKSIRKKPGIAGGIIVVLLALFVGFSIYNSPANRLSRQLDLGQRYLAEQNYEMAIVEFDKAIAIDSMSVDAYLGKAEAYIALGDVGTAIQTMEEGLEHTGNEQVKEMLVECYLNQAEEYAGKADYEKTLEVYDRLLEIDSENVHAQSDLQEIITRTTERKRIEEENAAFMQEVYDLMIAEDWESLRMLDETEEAASFIERMENDRYLYFPAENTAQTGIGMGVYKNESGHYFYCGDYVDSIRMGEGTFYETNNLDAFDIFCGEWKNDAPNGQGKLTKKYFLSGGEGDCLITVEGNYTDGLCDGYMNCILTDSENGDFNLSYYAADGTPEDITEKVHEMDVLSWRDNYIYAYGENDNSVSWNLHLNTKEDKLGVFGFESIHEQRWQDAYIGYINDKKHNGTYFDDTVYMLVDINNDDIPELYIDYGITSLGAVLCSYYEGSIIEQGLWSYGLSYIEGENLFMDSGGHMDSYYNQVYCIRDGEFVLLYKGEYGAPDNTHVQYDSEGNPLYDYYWGGTQMSSEAEYFQSINAVYDFQKAVIVREELTYDTESGRWIGNMFCDYEEIIEAINNY